MKKRVVLLCAILMLAALLAACGGGGKAESADIGTWTLAVEGVDGKTEFTNADAAKLTPVTVEMTITNKNGEAKTSKFTGLTLKSILESLGVSSVQGVTVVAADDFSADYDAALAMADDTVLAWAVNGELIDSEQPLRMCPNQGTGNMFIKDCAKIIVMQ